MGSIPLVGDIKSSETWGSVFKQKPPGREEVSINCIAKITFF